MIERALSPAGQYSPLTGKIIPSVTTDVVEKDASADPVPVSDSSVLSSSRQAKESGIGDPGAGIGKAADKVSSLRVSVSVKEESSRKDDGARGDIVLERNGVLTVIDESPTSPGESRGRVGAAIAKLLEDYPGPSAERDQLILVSCAREAVSGTEMEPYRYLLSEPGARFRNSVPDQRIFSGRPPDYRFLEGRNFDDIQGMVERFRPLYPAIRKLAVEIPPEKRTFYRWGERVWKEQATAILEKKGKMEVDDLYRLRGFTFDQMAIYAADNPTSSQSFGDTLQTLELAPETLLLDTTDPSVLAQLETLFEKADVYDEKMGYGRTGARTDLFTKAGIDVGLDIEDNLLLSRLDDRERELGSIEDPHERLAQAARMVSDEARTHFPGYYRIYNPEVIAHIR
ncbi:MAG: hypothetical protein HYU64_08230 [Armatimonadetes bacterium]|nr:hypothetical protein [Armatimonadota bacterium]